MSRDPNPKIGNLFPPDYNVKEGHEEVEGVGSGSLLGKKGGRDLLYVISGLLCWSRRYKGLLCFGRYYFHDQRNHRGHQFQGYQQEVAMTADVRVVELLVKIGLEN